MNSPIEFHIEIHQSLQKEGLNVFDDFHQEQIDWLINKEINRFKESKVRKKPDGSGGYEIDSEGLQDLEPLYTVNKELITYVNTTRKESYGILPFDCDYLINDRSVIYSDCTKTTVIINKVKNKTEYIAKILFNETAKSSTPFYTTFKVNYKGVEVFNIADYPTYTFVTKNQKYFIVNLVLEKLNRDGISVYWETYRDLYLANTFIFVSETSITGTNNIVVDSATVSATTTSTVYKEVDNTTNTAEVPNRLVRREKLSILQQNSFAKTIEKYPLSSLAKGILYVLFTERFIVNKVIIDYIRKPRKFSLSLNQNCELPEHTHFKICDAVVAEIKLIIQSPDWQVKMQSNSINNQ